MAGAAARPVTLPDGYSLVRRNPTTMRASEVDIAIPILRAGGAVDVSAARRGIPAATVLFYLHYRDNLVGLGAIKEKRPWYNHRIEKKAGYAFESSMLELGYVAVDPEHQGRRLSGRIVDELIAVCGGQLFATTDNELMKLTLSHRDFVQRGNQWSGTRGPLSLWLRNVTY